MKNYLLFALFCIFALNACTLMEMNSPDEPVGKEGVIEPKRPMCLVFCDFTQSVDTNSSKKIRNDAIGVYDKFSQKFDLLYYSISPNEFAGDFFRSRPLPKPKTTIKKLNHDKEIRALKDSLVHAFDSVKKGTGLGETCIIKSIEKAIKDLSNYDPAGTAELRIILLSDMLENCSSSLGRINLGDKEFGSDLSVVEKSNPALSFSKFRKMRIYAVVSAGGVTSGNKLEAFWHALFAKYQFADLPHLSSTLPDSFD